MIHQQFSEIKSPYRLSRGSRYRSSPVCPQTVLFRSPETFGKNSVFYFRKLLILLYIFLGITPAIADSDAVPRTIIALYNKKMYNDISDAAVHQFVEMPLNHLGYRVWYHDLEEGLPDLIHRSDVLGVITWFPGGMVVPDPTSYLAWAGELIDHGKRFVVIGNPGFYPADGSVTPDLRNAFWGKLGLYDQAAFVSATYDVKLDKLTPQLLDFEREYGGILPGYHTIKSASTDVAVHLVARIKDQVGTEAILVATHPSGGFIAEEYEVYWDNISDDHRQWYLNPFLFLKLAFGDDGSPKPDTTTLAGNRIFYHHIDGDGWISRSLISEYRKTRTLCAEVIYHKVLKAFPDLPCSVGPIAADLDDSWVGTAESRQWAKEILALPNVEVACHTYSHPFQWGFFVNYSMAKEEPYLYLYPFGSWSGTSLWVRLKHYVNLLVKKPDLTPSYDGVVKLDVGYDLPRAYANKPFNLHREVYGAVDKINEFAPPGKKVMLYSWSGDCVPFEQAVADTRKAGVLNLNGGNTRFDSESLSYGWVRPLGRQAGVQRQIYASTSNENIYTDNWTGRFYNFNLLPQTLKNTDTPIRVKPMNLYYHMFSGEKLPALEALLSNVAYIRAQESIPIKASTFAAIADGFYKTEIYQLAQGQWRVSNRGQLQTVRFDNSTLRSVDFRLSKGVIGQRHFQGSLYVALDPEASDPVVALHDCLECYASPPAPICYLVNSRWEIASVKHHGDQGVSFITQGFGRGTMTWSVPHPGTYNLTVSTKSQAPSTREIKVDAFTMTFSISEGSSTEPVHVEIERAS